MANIIKRPLTMDCSVIEQLLQLEVTCTGLLFLHVRPPWNPDLYESVDDILKMSSWQLWATMSFVV